ncbi:MAG: hypothetical protein KY476_24620 [Planctomycetes bacterium]|nr:hypothetical protein [Planctomycetota bacterium]
MTVKEVLPKSVYWIEVPMRADDLAKRYHNQYAKEAIRETLEKWHGSEKGFKKHFRRDARERYDHFPRSEKYKRFKARRYHSTVDLIKTGQTKRYMQMVYKITAGGTAVGKTLRATLILRFPFKGGTGRFRKVSQQQVSIEKMRIELERFDDEDPKILAQWFLAAYMRRVRNHRANRKRVRISR